ncbi:hypothetical protein [Paracoccus sp. (in: a-proteobacteria)]|uniref:hypothetical protein n=1 Tax=Paracoccus sp. TaxID=267 RepID=UPI0026DF92A9|nr:hypothetical protein [Paracoccus sp. (in: a-proteobacteria)]
MPGLLLSACDEAEGCWGLSVGQADAGDVLDGLGGGKGWGQGLAYALGYGGPDV